MVQLEHKNEESLNNPFVTLFIILLSLCAAMIVFVTIVANPLIEILSPLFPYFDLPVFSEASLAKFIGLYLLNFVVGILVPLIAFIAYFYVATRLFFVLFNISLLLSSKFLQSSKKRLSR